MQVKYFMLYFRFAFDASSPMKSFSYFWSLVSHNHANRDFKATPTYNNTPKLIVVTVSNQKNACRWVRRIEAFLTMLVNASDRLIHSLDIHVAITVLHTCLQNIMHHPQYIDIDLNKSGQETISTIKNSYKKFQERGLTYNCIQCMNAIISTFNSATMFLNSNCFLLFRSCALSFLLSRYLTQHKCTKITAIF